MRIPIILLTILLHILIYIYSFAQDIPLVYDVENTCPECSEPPLPAFNDLPVVEPLTDPFSWSDGSGRDTTFANWIYRRAEIAAEIQHYEIGTKPTRPDTIAASFSYTDSTLTVNVTKNGKTLTLTSHIYIPDGEGPFPAVVGMVWIPGFGSTGGLPPEIFTDRNIATIEFVHDQVTAYGGPSLSDPYFRLYPDQNLNNTGQYSAWAWGVSRLIDGLELVQDSLPIDMSHLAVTGCSYAGKMALFAGALDERIALTIAQESGGGGAPAWRVSETLGGVETIGATDYNWFRESMRDFSGQNVSKLPEDHHELMAMVAPRALLVTGNTDYTWLANPSCYVASRATQKVYDTFGISDRFGFYIDGGHGHCSVPASQIPSIEAFLDKFLLGDTLANTDIAVNPYDYIDYARWFEWWGSEEPYFPEPDTANIRTIAFEAECADPGEDWQIKANAQASNGYYVTVTPGVQSIDAAPSNDAGIISIPFSIDTSANFAVFGRLNCPTPDDDSYWIKMDNGDFVRFNGLGTNGWQWVSLGNYMLEEGEHTLEIGYREDGALLDKILVSNYLYTPEGMGEEAVNLCNPTAIYSPKIIKSYTLEQNYPNPFNPSTNISFRLPKKEFVTLKVYNVLGQEVITLINEVKAAGEYHINFNGKGLVSGTYFYELKAGDFSKKRKMVLIK